jgi:hypothetical protein
MVLAKRGCVGRRLAFFASIVIACWPSNAFAYRPFDSTDPAVADLNSFEVELSPVSYRHDDSGRTWIAPQLRLNYGFAKDWEVVLEGQGEHQPGFESRLVEDALSLKYIIKEGTPQDMPGPSVATEFGVLLPGVHDQKGTGATITGIVGQKFSWGAVHVNLSGSLTRDQRGEIFFGTILEGPEAWPVRPVAEFVYQRESGGHNETALLAGIIWKVKDSLAFDFALRHAKIDGRPETEVRAGLTFDFSYL